MEHRPLADRIALVAGATRGAGRGIATQLGAAGATVYCSGRSVRGAPATEGRPETIEGTAERVSRAGGRGIAVRCDHTDEEQVRALVRRIDEEAGRLDLLVNDVWGGDARTEWGKPFWELDYGRGRELLRHAVDTHILTTKHSAPLLERAERGLIVEITDGAGTYYRGNLYYDLAKMTVIRLAVAWHHELKDRGVSALALTPGFLRSEAMLEHFGVTADNWRDGVAKDPYFAASESPAYVGRAVVALAADPEIARKSGGAYATWGLYKEYGFTDVDGTQPDFVAFLNRTVAEELAGRSLEPQSLEATVHDVFVSKHLSHVLPLLTPRFYADLADLGPSPSVGDLERLVGDHLGLG